MTKYFHSVSDMSQAMVLGGLVHIACQVANGHMARVYGQARAVLEKLDKLLAETGNGKPRFVAINSSLPQIRAFEAMNVACENSMDREYRREPASRRALPILTYASRSSQSRPCERR